MIAWCFITFLPISGRCTYTNLFADTDEEVIKADPGIDEDMLDLSRGAASFAIFTIFTMILGFIFTVYTFMNPRYMYKRLAGGVHFISGLTSATVCHLLHMTVTHAREKLKYAFPDGATYTWDQILFCAEIILYLLLIDTAMASTSVSWFQWSICSPS